MESARRHDNSYAQLNFSSELAQQDGSFTDWMQQKLTEKAEQEQQERLENERKEQVLIIINLIEIQPSGSSPFPPPSPSLFLRRFRKDSTSQINPTNPCIPVSGFRNTASSSLTFLHKRDQERIEKDRLERLRAERERRLRAQQLDAERLRFEQLRLNQHRAAVEKARQDHIMATSIARKTEIKTTFAAPPSPSF